MSGAFEILDLSDFMFLELTSLSSFLDGYSNSYGSTYHRVVAHADQTHHLNVCRYGGRTSELRVRVHTAQSIGETVRSGTCSHVIGMQSTSGTAAGSYGEVLLACFQSLLLVVPATGCWNLVGLVELPVMDTSTFSFHMIATPSGTLLAP